MVGVHPSACQVTLSLLEPRYMRMYFRVLAQMKFVHCTTALRFARTNLPVCQAKRPVCYTKLLDNLLSKSLLSKFFALLSKICTFAKQICLTILLDKNFA